MVDPTRAGGMATVHLAHDVRHDRKVALKVLRPELAAVVGAERFLAEITTTASLQHPHILPLFDSGRAGSFLFYVMPSHEALELPAWTPDGGNITFASQRVAETVAVGLGHSLWTQPANGTGEAVLSYGSANVGEGVWSPDRKWLVIDGIPTDRRRPRTSLRCDQTRTAW